MQQRPEIRIAVAVPSQDSVRASFAYDLARLMTWTAAAAPELELRLFMHHGTILPEQRQALAMEAIAADCTHILWLDSDMRFPKDALLRLLAHDKAIVAANYSKRRAPIGPVATVIEGDKRRPLYTREGDTDVVPVEQTGMGCMLVQIDVFKNLPLPWFFFEWDSATYNYGGEDAFFCLHAGHHGVQTYVDQRLSHEIAHIGEFEFRAEHAVILEGRGPRIVGTE